MRALICGLNYEPECIGIAVYTSGLAEFLSRKGHDVTVVTAHPYYPEWRRRPGWSRWRYVRSQPQGAPQVVHCPHFVPATPSFLKRMVHYLSFLLASLPVALWFSLRQRPDIVLAIAPSLVASLCAVICARVSGARLVLHIQDFEVDAAFATGALDKRGRLGRLALGFERWMLRRFDLVSTISEPMMRKAAEKGIAKDRIVEFRNWADLSNVTPLSGPSPMRDELGLGDKSIVLYSGNIAAKQGIEIIPAAARLLSHRPDIAFVVCGNGAYLETLRKSSAGLDNIRFIPLQPLERLGDLLGMADVHVLPQIADVNELVLPSKLANMLASGRPIIATTVPGSAIAQELDGCGIIVAPGDEAGLAAAISSLIDRPDDRRAMGLRARQRADMRWDAEQVLERYNDRLTRLVKPLPQIRPAKDETA